MTNPFIAYSFTAGELSEELLGRTDIAKYPVGLEKAVNMFVDYRGAAVSRPGLRNHVPIDSDEVKLFRFRALEDDYLLVLTPSKMRFFRAGGYLLEGSQTVTALDYPTGVFTCNAHGFSDGDMVYFSADVTPSIVSSQYFEVTAATANTFKVVNFDDDRTIVPIFLQDVVAFGGFPTVSQVHTVATPFASFVLPTLHFEQDNQFGVFTSTESVQMLLEYVNDLSWLLTPFDVTPATVAPAKPTVTTTGAGTFTVLYGVAAVIDGVETPISPLRAFTTSKDALSSTNLNRISWNNVLGAQSYNVYKSLTVLDNNYLNQGEFMGYIGSSYGNQFSDTGLIPDFTKSPATRNAPFALGQIVDVIVTAPGSGYSFDDQITFSNGDGNFLGYVVLNSTGGVTAVKIANAGSGYDADGPVPVASITGSGTGAVLTAVMGPAYPNNIMLPSTFTKFQQRYVFAGTRAVPMGIWATKPRTKNNFDSSEIVTAGDGYFFSLDAPDVEPVRHLLSLRSGLLVFTASEINLLRAEEGKAVSAVNALSEPQAYKGASKVKPLKVDLDVIFSETKGGSLVAMQYTEYTNTFQLEDLSVYSKHLITDGGSLQKLDYAAEPHKLIYAVRADGDLITITFDRKNEVTAWTRQETLGDFRDLCVATVDNSDTVYCAVTRPLKARTVTYLESFAPREVQHIEDAFCVDAGRSLGAKKGNGTITFSSAAGTAVNCTSPTKAFIGTSVGDIIYADGGKFRVDAVLSQYKVKGTWLRDAVKRYHTSDLPRIVRTGFWSYVTPVTTVTGLWHLEGELVSVLADEEPAKDVLVVNGSITLSTPATKVCVGLPFISYGKPLPPTTAQAIIDAKRRTITDVAFRVKNTRGLKFGFSLDRLYEMKDRSTEAWGEPIRAQNGIRHVSVNSGWEYSDSIYFYQDYPLPYTILSVVHNTIVGDD